MRFKGVQPGWLALAGEVLFLLLSPENSADLKGLDKTAYTRMNETQHQAKYSLSQEWKYFAFARYLQQTAPLSIWSMGSATFNLIIAPAYVWSQDCKMPSCSDKQGQKQ